MTYLSKMHPVRVLLEQAAAGRPPTKAQLDDLLARDDLPEGHDLARFRSRVVTAARRVAEAGAGGQHIVARREAERSCSELAEAMTPEEAGIDTTHPPGSEEPLDTISARMFGGF